MQSASFRGWSVMGGLVLSAGVALGQPFVLPASLDRWNYPFAGTPGVEQTIPIFAALEQAGFDDRDSQFVLGFSTAGVLETLRGPAAYSVTSARIRVWINNPPRFLYDPTYDSYRTSLPTTDAAFMADSDAGKPIEMFAMGFRNGVTSASYTETTPYTVGNPFPPQERRRSVYPSVLGPTGGVGLDVSNQVADRFEVTPMAIATTTSVAPGELVPTNAEFVFDLDLTVPGNLAYVRQALDSGRLLVVVSSLHPASGGPGGGTGDYPTFYTRENPVAQANGGQFVAKLELSASVGNIVDFNNDGVFPDDQDLVDLLFVLGGGTCPTCSSVDINRDGVFPEDGDLAEFLRLLGGG